ncbi:MAG: hypothetical protein Phog2KO_19700 [Phototrophicaceae bacterium]
MMALSYTDLETLRFSGGDEFWYLVNGLGLFQEETSGLALGYPYAAHNLPIAPIYLIITGLFQQFFPINTAIIMIRIFQMLLSILTCYFAYDIGRLLSKDERVGLASAGALAFSITWILEPNSILSETVYITLICLSIWIYCRYIVTRDDKKWSMIILVGICLGLATLTRAVGILFPIGIAGHLVIISGKDNWKRSILLALGILLSYGVTISTWTVYNWVNYERFIIVSNQFMPAIWRGAVEGDGSPEENDELLGDDTPLAQTSDIIANDPTAFVQRRINELSDAYLQPHGTLNLGGESLKALALNWLNSGFSWDGFQQLIQGEGFWIKLIIYIWHYVSLIGGLIGMWLSRKDWQVSLVLIGFIVYTTLIHFVGLALPRYIFPTFPFFWIFASVTLVSLWDLIRGNKKEADRNLPQI